MGILIYFFIFISGLAIGSFLNCIIYRLGIEKSFLFGRSSCPNCQYELKWHDLIPILSFFILGGKCRHCKKPISWQYPLVELATGILFVFMGYQFLYEIPIRWLDFFYLLFITSILIIIFVYDLKNYLIPDKIILPAILVSLIIKIISAFWQFHFSKESLHLIYNGWLAALGAGAFFLFIVLVSRGRWMGIGDIKLAFLMGLSLGFPDILVALFFAFFFGAIIGLGLIALGKKTFKSEIPFGPFLVTGTFIGLFWANNLINFYLNLTL